MPLPHEPGERWRFTTEFTGEPHDCPACVAGRCVQMVVSHPKWRGDVVVHDARENLDIMRLVPLFEEPEVGVYILYQYRTGAFCLGWLCNDLPDTPAVLTALRNLGP